MTEPTKVCNSCFHDKPISEFGRSRSMFDGRTTQCRECRNQKTKDLVRRQRRSLAESRREWMSGWGDEKAPELIPLPQWIADDVVYVLKQTWTCT